MDLDLPFSGSLHRAARSKSLQFSSTIQATGPSLGVRRPPRAPPTRMSKAIHGNTWDYDGDASSDDNEVVFPRTDAYLPFMSHVSFPRRDCTQTLDKHTPLPDRISPRTYSLWHRDPSQDHAVQSGLLALTELKESQVIDRFEFDNRSALLMQFAEFASEPFSSEASQASRRAKEPFITRDRCFRVSAYQPSLPHIQPICSNFSSRLRR